MIVNKDFKEFIQLLNKNKVKYLIVGGYAVAFHGYPRYTKDIDIWIKAEGENAKNIIKTLNQFGFSFPNLTDADFLISDQVIQLGCPPNRIDLLTSISGVSFDECYEGRVIESIEGVDVSFIGILDLKKNVTTHPCNCLQIGSRLEKEGFSSSGVYK